MLLPDVANDSERLARFRSEAQVLARTISTSDRFTVSRNVRLKPDTTAPPSSWSSSRGATLADRIARGAILLVGALPIAKQIAEALEAARWRRAKF